MVSLRQAARNKICKVLQFLELGFVQVVFGLFSARFSVKKLTIMLVFES
jgi:hypothetical protein